MINFLAVFLVLLSPELEINWLNQDPPAIELRLVGDDELFNKCLARGQEVQYRFEFQLCKKSSWIDSCSKEVVQTHFLSWSPISNSYSMIIDRHRDENLPKGVQFNQRADAERAIREISKLEILELFKKEHLEKKHYLRARAFSECQGEYHEIFVDLSYYLTLGLLRLNGFNTGWYDYELHD